METCSKCHLLPMNKWMICEQLAHFHNWRSEGKRDEKNERGEHCKNTLYCPTNGNHLTLEVTGLWKGLWTNDENSKKKKLYHSYSTIPPFKKKNTIHKHTIKLFIYNPRNKTFISAVTFHLKSYARIKPS